jgi:hypothetical protein
VAFAKTQKPFDHVLVRAEDGRLIDIGGARTPAEIVAGGGHLSGVTTAALERGSRAPRTASRRVLAPSPGLVQGF